MILHLENPEDTTNFWTWQIQQKKQNKNQHTKVSNFLYVMMNSWERNKKKKTQAQKPQKE
jgi:hypothetical protein